MPSNLTYSLDIAKNHKDGLEDLAKLLATLPAPTSLIGLEAQHTTNYTGTGRALPITPEFLATLPITEYQFIPDGIYIQGTRYTIHTLSTPLQPSKVGINTIEELWAFAQEVHTQSHSLYLIDNSTPTNYQQLTTNIKEHITITQDTCHYNNKEWHLVVILNTPIQLTITPNLKSKDPLIPDLAINIITSVLTQSQLLPVLVSARPELKHLYIQLDNQFKTSAWDSLFFSNPYILYNGTAFGIAYIKQHTLDEKPRSIQALKATFLSLAELHPSAKPILISNDILYTIPEDATDLTTSSLCTAGKTYIFGLLYPPLSKDVIETMITKYKEMVNRLPLPAFNRDTIEALLATTFQLLAQKSQDQEWLTLVKQSFNTLLSVELRHLLKPSELTRLEFEQEKLYKRYK